MEELGDGGEASVQAVGRVADGADAQLGVGVGGQRQGVGAQQQRRLLGAVQRHEGQQRLRRQNAHLRRLEAVEARQESRSFEGDKKLGKTVPVWTQFRAGESLDWLQMVLHWSTAVVSIEIDCLIEAFFF